MNKKVALTVILAASLLLSGCMINIRPQGIHFGDGLSVNAINGSGKSAVETRDVKDFSAVSFSGIGELTITQGEKEALEVEAEDNLLPVITTEVRDGTLEIGIKDYTNIDPNLPIRYRLTVRNLEALSLSGAGAARVEKLTTGKMSLTLSGAGSLSMDDLEAESLNTVLSGAGSIDLSGKVESQTVKLSGFGDYQAGSLQSADTHIDLSGAGNVELWVEGTMNVNLPGAGSVHYYGSPTVQQTISGVGRVEGLGAK